jgi:hypothetical protein
MFQRLAGLGLAVGALIGALMPTSETEDRMMGEASDRVKERAAEQYETARKVGERAFGAAKDEAVKQASQDDTSESKGEEEETTGEVKSEDPTLAPSDRSEFERRGQPWTPDNAPL